MDQQHAYKNRTNNTLKWGWPSADPDGREWQREPSRSGFLWVTAFRCQSL